ncbi:hypothetical protein [Nocardia sp. NPDC058633]|uniref:RskA family anti-sigma factor n=1 Tax=Nocardia sp. NPDC058633 TaxID=3346568 RepID=UPI00365767BE
MSGKNRRIPWSWMDDAYPYALDALEPWQRRAVDEWLVAAPDRAPEFHAAVHHVHEIMAALTVFDSVASPVRLESALLRALDRQDRRPHPLARRDAPARRYLRWSAAAIVALGAGLGIAAAITRRRSTRQG